MLHLRDKRVIDIALPHMLYGAKCWDFGELEPNGMKLQVPVVVSEDDYR